LLNLDGATHRIDNAGELDQQPVASRLNNAAAVLLDLRVGMKLTRFRGARQAFKLTEAFQMPKTRPPYSPEFRRQMVDLVRAGRDPADLAREFEPTAQSISHWVAQADRQEGRREEKGGGLTAAERDELARLRRENKQLRLERDILSRAAAWFARETGTIPSGSSSS
jgi:transposase